jgi:integrase
MPRARRGRGEGSIRQRANGLWMAEISRGYHPDGRRRRESIYAADKDELLTKLAQAQVDDAKGVRRASKRSETLGAYLDRWLEDSVEPNVAPATYRWYEQAVRVQIKPSIGGVRMKDLAPSHVQYMHAWVAERGSPTRVKKGETPKRKAAGDQTRRRAHATLHRALQQALRWGEIPVNPTTLVDAPRYRPSAMRPLTKEQANALLEHVAGDRLEALYVLAIFTGMREGELFGLQWDDVDLVARSLTIRRAVREAGTKIELAVPKTDSGRRKIALSPPALVALRKHQKRAMRDRGRPDTLLVFPDADGKPMRRSNFLRRDFYPLLEEAELPKIRFHDLRHTFATLMLGENVHPKIVQEALGHTQISTTLDLYSHTLPEMHREAVERLGRAVQMAVRPKKPGPKSGHSMRRKPLR